MRTESSTRKDSPIAVMGEVAPRTPWRVTEVEALPGFQLRVVFADGLTGTVDMSRIVHSPDAGVFSVLADPSVFSQASLEFGAVTWPGELDLAPDAMHTAIQEHSVWHV